ncbi:MAG: hypothetical protein ACK53T_01410 [Planctomycetota bacterium]|jgi:hypothetical protein
MAQVKFKVTNNDPVTGKRMILELTAAPIGRDGYPLFVQYLVTLKETNETTDAIPNGTTQRARKAVESYEETFMINQRKISSTTRLYLSDDTVDPNAITLAFYFESKILNTFPGVGNGDCLDDLARGILREVILIRQANGELPV